MGYFRINSEEEWKCFIECYKDAHKWADGEDLLEDHYMKHVVYYGFVSILKEEGVSLADEDEIGKEGIKSLKNHLILKRLGYA